MTKKAWSGRFKKDENPLMEKFNASLFFDKRLYEQDIQGSLAHAEMLHHIGILNQSELKKMSQGLSQVLTEIQKNQFVFRIENEDIHMAIEARLTEIIGPVAGKLHTGRSRNDQVALDVKLFAIKHTQRALKKISLLQKSFVQLAEKNLTVILPGYTHLQRAQPIYLSHHLLAYFEMLQRDFGRFSDALTRMNECPLGAGALAGSPIPLDRHFVAKKLGFADVTHNSLDTVADRDFLIEYLSTASILMMHLSRFCEELIIWNSQEFSFVELPQEFCTGSSMMPQKINPDAPELIRGKVGRVYGSLLALLTVMKSLPLAYNKDMQEDKESFFNAVDTVENCLDILIVLVEKLQFNKDNMLEATKKGFLLATDLADYLAKKSLPFREAHEVVGKLVQYCIEKKCGLEDLSLEELQKESSLISKDVFAILSISHSVETRQTLGGTSLASIKKELKRAQKILNKVEQLKVIGSFS